ncbi:MAG: 2-aminoethylphosphonate-pyruvate transaminase [Clostridium butyricum]|jgi:2-aminoethylphosphonate-pyruvate transaminase|uniref:2-aminoethylphosphonate--pyruvate transaminase n=1 Tax=Clostridium butyricum TaxID=1492 RepID=A0A6L9EIM5_CLOBU|nr:2-aminoethylphosphonate--pyruvate transaminase [Clostridium butyricum]MDK2827867.1 2-aminoethylphosphonate-pyruvate transaminase [Clostridium butyricum]NAS16331.1 2-aminoethylphosphonate--pyruvate transaminase [Clostridium butyricum]RQN03099.1 2-aminoethylphosphonate--pyruvate transaminase [Clostridium butyricum]
MKNYKLLTPGPLTTTEAVKKEMLFDRCTWDDEYKSITQKIRKELLDIGNVNEEDYTAVLMQGSGTFAVESVITSTVGEKDKLLIIANGAYGERIGQIAEHISLNHVIYNNEYDEHPDMDKVKEILDKDTEITHIAMVHCETTTGILNPIEDLSVIAKEYNKTLIIDAMSSFGGIPIDIKALGIDYLISSANKCIQGVPGFGFVIAKKEKLEKCKGISRSLSLDLYDQYKGMDKDGKWRFTSPTHVVAAFSKALDELKEEGGVEGRYNRYKNNNLVLRKKLKEIGIESYIEEEKQSPIITTFAFPTDAFSFNEFYSFIKERGFVIYPGKLTDVDTFRIGNIGEIYEEDINKLCEIIEEYVKGMK